MKKIIAILTVFVIIMAVFSSFFVLYATGNVETESNNSFATANSIDDDTTMYGTIGSSTDVDYWEYTAGFTGSANIWLGSIPSGCDYNIYFYSSDYTYIACSVKVSGTQELMKCRVYTGYTYYIKVVSASGYNATSQYKLRVKNYSLGNAKMFVYNVTDLNTLPAANTSFPYIWEMGYTGTWYLNNAVTPAYNVFPSTQVFVVCNHAAAGRIRFDTSATNFTRLFGQNPTTGNKAISSYSSDQLSEVRLAIYLGCNTGNTDTSTSNNGNLVTQTLSKGAYCAMGWCNQIHNQSMNDWITYFFFQSDNGKNMLAACMAADNYIQEHYSATYWNELKNRYTGSSRTASLSL